ncbi:hypothetical protein [Tateyamaria omphalii]|nr:hypothetical protein [Tateyamaria omphalii]
MGPGPDASLGLPLYIAAALRRAGGGVAVFVEPSGCAVGSGEAGMV